MASKIKPIAQPKTASNGNLPKGWRMVPFGELAQNVAERVDPSETDADIYVGLEHLDSDSLKIRRWGTPSDVIGDKLRFQKGDIIFGRRRAYQRKLGVAEFDGICSAHAMVVRANTEIVDPTFLAFLMQSDMFMQRAIDISVGSLSPTINWKTMRIQEFPLPPKDEQQRIAEILFSAADMVEHLNDSASKCDRIRRLLLHRCMRGLETNGPRSQTSLGKLPRDWKVMAIGEAGHVQLGRQRAPKYQTGKFTKPYLRVANVFDGFLDLSDVLEMDFDERDFETYVLRQGDILLNEGQSRELVGRCAIYNSELVDCCFQNTLIRFRTSVQILPKFAFYYFQHLFYTGVFAAVARQTTSMAHLGADRFAKLPMAVPPVDEQTRIVEGLDAILEGSNQIDYHRRQAELVKCALREELLTRSR